MCALAAAEGKLLVADSQGHVSVLSMAALLRGETHSISFRAHDGKVATLHARRHDGSFLSGGTDGAVRCWQFDELRREAAAVRSRERIPAGQAVAGQEVVGQAVAGQAVAGQVVADQAVAVEKAASAAFGGAGRLHGGGCVDLGLWAIASSAACLCVARHQDTIVAVCRDGELAISASREGHVQVSRLADGQSVCSLPEPLGTVNCMTAHRGKLLICSDDGHQAMLQLWNLDARAGAHGPALVQELGGIRKWNAPTSIAYMGCDRAFWVRDTTLSVLTWNVDQA